MPGLQLINQSRDTCARLARLVGVSPCRRRSSRRARPIRRDSLISYTNVIVRRRMVNVIERILLQGCPMTFSGAGGNAGPGCLDVRDRIAGMLLTRTFAKNMNGSLKSRGAGHRPSLKGRYRAKCFKHAELDFCSEDKQAFVTRRCLVNEARRVLSIFAASRQTCRFPSLTALSHV